MTLNELRIELHRLNYPPTYVVGNETYDAALAAVLDNLHARGLPAIPYAGPNGGLMFKGVELLESAA